MAYASVEHKETTVTLELTEREANIVAAILDCYGCSPAEDFNSLDEEINEIYWALASEGYDGEGFDVITAPSEEVEGEYKLSVYASAEDE